MKRNTLKFAMFLFFLIMIGALSRSVVQADQDIVKVFNSKCAKCHGQKGKATKRGEKLGAKNFKDINWQKSITDEEILDAISNGKNKMPGWKDKLDRDGIKKLAHYVRVLLPHGERKKMPKNIQRSHYSR
ncbi:MAG: c-type cytochrome [Candidatus Anammoxibacter sp.]